MRRRTGARGVARENVSWLRSRVTTLRVDPRPRPRGRPARFLPWRRGGKTRLVSLSLITILCVVVDDEGRRRASGPVYRQQENRPVCVRACAATRRTGRSCCACTSARARPSLSAPLFFYIFFAASLASYLCLSLSPSLILFSSLSRFFPLVLFAPLAPPECQGACCEEATLATLARSARCQLVATHLPSRLSRHRQAMRECESDRSFE